MINQRSNVKLGSNRTLAAIFLGFAIGEKINVFPEGGILGLGGYSNPDTPDIIFAILIVGAAILWSLPPTKD